MSLPAATKSHHTVWVDVPSGRTAAIRYATDGDRLVCFGDDGLSGVPDGTRLTAAVRGLACGPLEATFWVRVKTLGADEVPFALLSDIVGDHSLGHNSEEVTASLEALRSSRRIVALEG